MQDLSTREKEYAALMYPVTAVFDWDRWQDGFDKYWRGDENEPIRERFRTFKRHLLENFKYYRVPVISLERGTYSQTRVSPVFSAILAHVYERAPRCPASAPGGPWLGRNPPKPHASSDGVHLKWHGKWRIWGGLQLDPRGFLCWTPASELQTKLKGIQWSG